MKKIILSLLLTTVLATANPAYQIIQYSQIGYDKVVSVLTIVAGLAAINDINRRSDRVLRSAVPLTVNADAEDYIMTKTNTDRDTARTCYNRVMFTTEYAIFAPEWNSRHNMAKHACGHNLANPRNYLLTTSLKAGIIKSAKSFMNKWKIQGQTRNIIRDGRLCVFNPQGRLISSFNTANTGGYRPGGVTFAKYRKAMGWN